MADAKVAYGTTTSITITLASLANAAARESTVVDNGTNKFLDALVYLAIAVGTVANPKEIRVYVYGSEDGTNYERPATGSDAGVTLDDPPLVKLARVIPVPTSSVTYKAIFSIAQCFGGSLPRKWGIIVENQSGAALSASGHAASYTGIFQTIV